MPAFFIAFLLSSAASIGSFLALKFFNRKSKHTPSAALDKTRAVLLSLFILADCAAAVTGAFVLLTVPGK